MSDLAQPLLADIRERLLSTEDTVCLERARLVTEAFRRHEDEPPPTRRALAFAHVLGHMTLDLDTNPVFAGNTSSRPRAWMLVPEHGFCADAQIEWENPGLRGFLEGKIPPDLRDFWAERSFGGGSGIGHLAVDLHRVVHEGLEAVLADLERQSDQSERPSDSSDQLDGSTYRRAMAIGLRAVIAWAGRYADAAEEAARSEPDPVLRAAHVRVAHACRQVPARPARDLFEGLQAILLVHLAIAIEGHGYSVSIGLPDRVLAPFVGAGFDAESATHLIHAFLLKIAANSIWGRASKTQAITVGGADQHGRGCCNPLTLCFLEACNRARVGDPHLFLRWHPSLDPRVKQRAAELLAGGLSMPLLVNDPPTAAGFIGAGVRPEDAWEYCVIGCNELGIPGRSAESANALAGTVQYPHLLNETLLHHPDPDGVAGPGELLAGMEERLGRRAREMRRSGEAHRRRMAAAVPTPFTSSLMRGCIARGRDLLEGMEYHLPCVYERGLTNAANALAAVEQVVFGGAAGRSMGSVGSMGSMGSRMPLHFPHSPHSPYFPYSPYSLAQVTAALRDDFPDPAVRERILAAPKWGSDDDRADRWAAALVEMRERVLDAVDAEFDGRRHVVCHVVRSLHHVDGAGLGASPDGRRAGAPLADSIGAQAGTARAGPTGVLSSVLKLDAARCYRGGYNLNLTLPRTDASPGTVLALIEGFFGADGQELQIGCLNAGLLRDARAHPERHGDLVVRIAGFSARFVDLSPVEQDELIARADAATEEE